MSQRDDFRRRLESARATKSQRDSDRKGERGERAARRAGGRSTASSECAAGRHPLRPARNRCLCRTIAIAIASGLLLLLFLPSEHGGAAVSGSLRSEPSRPVSDHLAVCLPPSPRTCLLAVVTARDAAAVWSVGAQTTGRQIGRVRDS